MTYKNKENEKRYKREHYLKNKDKYKERAKVSNEIYRERNRKFVNDYKLKHGCSICGYNKCASAIDFHHESDKVESVARLVNFSCSTKRILEEIDRCIVVCATCHREIHDIG